MKHLFLPYKLAVIAKEKGFDEPCFGWWFGDGSSKEPHFQAQLRQSDIQISAPLYQQITDWFREKHKIVIYPDYSDCNSLPVYIIKWHNGICHNEMRVADFNAAIQHAFTLI